MCSGGAKNPDFHLNKPDLNHSSPQLDTWDTWEMFGIFHGIQQVNSGAPKNCR